MTRVAQMREAAAKLATGWPCDEHNTIAQAIRALPEPPKPTHKELMRVALSLRREWHEVTYGEVPPVDEAMLDGWLAVAKRAMEIYG